MIWIGVPMCAACYDVCQIILGALRERRMSAEELEAVVEAERAGYGR